MRCLKLMSLSLMAATVLATSGFAAAAPAKSPVDATLDARCGILPALMIPPAKDVKARAAILKKKVDNALCRDRALLELSAAMKASQAKVNSTKRVLANDATILIVDAGSADKTLVRTLLGYLNSLGGVSPVNDDLMRPLPLNEGKDARYAPVDDSKMTYNPSVRPGPVDGSKMTITNSVRPK